MPILASDIALHGSAVMADDDTILNIGGILDVTRRVVFTPLDATGAIEMLSTAAGDTTQNVTVTGRNAAGELVTETKALNGVTVVDFVTVFERLLKVVLSATAVGTVTIRKDLAAGDLMVFEPGLTEIRRPFYAAQAEAAGGAARSYFEKVFFRNNHATLSLTGAVVSLPNDAGGLVTFSLEGALDGVDSNGGGNNRQVAPGGHAFDAAAKNVPNAQNHTALAAIGVWLKLSLAAGAAPAKLTFQLSEAGASI